MVLCQSLRCTSRSSGDTLPRLNRVWKQFTVTSEERVHRLETAVAFHSSAEKVSVMFLRRKISYQNVSKQKVANMKLSMHVSPFLNTKIMQKEEFKRIFLNFHFST